LGPKELTEFRVGQLRLGWGQGIPGNPEIK